MSVIFCGDASLGECEMRPLCVPLAEKCVPSYQFLNSKEGQSVKQEKTEPVTAVRNDALPYKGEASFCCLSIKVHGIILVK